VPREEDLKPSAIDLPCTGETWTVRYMDRQGDCIEIRPRPEDNLLEVEGPLAEEGLVTGLLQDWLKRRARGHLTGLIREESKRTGLVYDRLQFRIQKSRWGSRSASGTISLNACLLFLEEPLVRHILLHELCHTVHMNHSNDFWGLVARFDPHWKQNASLARRAFIRVPRWALYKKGIRP
jgi:predicted metal-dependent hydrolase